MKVSVSLHITEPSNDGNQRTAEAVYMGYNRAYATLVVDTGNTGNGMAKLVDLTFPEVQGDPPDPPYTFFSIGVCEGVPQGKGGAIIIYGPLDPPLSSNVGEAPVITDQLVGVFAARLAEMRADGRMGPND